MVTPIPPLVGSKEVTIAIHECLTVLCDVSRIYGFEGEWDSSVTLRRWAAMAEACGGNWVKVAKYKLAAFFASHTAQPLPRCPYPSVQDEPNKLCGGRLGRFHDLQMSRLKGRERLSFLASLKQAKKGMPRVAKATLKQKEEEFGILMTTEIPDEAKGSWVETGPEDHISKGMENHDDALTITKAELEIQLDRTVDELFTIPIKKNGEVVERRDIPFTMEERLRAVFPSTSANYIRSRNNGGAVGAILEHPDLLKSLRRPGGYTTVETKKAQELIELDREDHRDEHISNEDEDVRGKHDIIGGWVGAYQEFWTRLGQVAAKEQPIVEPVALAEPLKVRMITKGPPFTYTMLECVRRKMHDTLRNHPAFQLIGEPCSEEYLLNRLGRELGPKQGFLSGDYEAATDNMFSWVSRRIATRVADRLKLTELERQKFLEALTEHLFEVKDPTTGERTLRRQTRGQLMGSNVSFPVLCIAVGCVARLSCEKDQGRNIPLKDAPIAINGDDNATKCTERGKRWWTLISAAMGLKESVGKTYFSREFVEINSTIFTYKRESLRTFTETNRGRAVTRQLPYEQVKYVNMGLLAGLKRSGGAVTLKGRQEPSNDIGTRYRKLLELAPDHLHERLHKIFIEKHRSILAAYGCTPWAVPTWIGGVGLIGFLHPSETDLRVAGMILRNWKKKRPIDSAVQRDVPWKVWDLASRRVPEPEYAELPDIQGEEVYEGLMAAECINLLFDSTVNLSRLHPEGEASQDDKRDAEKHRAWEKKRMVNHNRRLWDPSSYKGLGPPIDADRLIFRSMYPTYPGKIYLISSRTDNPTLLELET